MANNNAWTTSLGQAYYNDPSDVMNAIQVMRQRAQAAGNLASNRQVRVSQAAPSDAYALESDTPDVYDGPAVVPPPPEMIAIEPAQPDVVYVPMYDPALVYGAPMAMYPDYIYRSPPMMPGVAVVGPISFGTGIIIGATFGAVAWGWHAWGVHWGGPHDHGGYGRPGGWQRPAVVYNHTTYVSRSPAFVNHRFNENRPNNATHAPNFSAPNNRELPSARPMTMPHFTPNDERPGTRPEARPFAQPVPHPQPEPHPQPRLHPQPEPHPQPQLHSQPQFHPQPQFRPQPHPQPQQHMQQHLQPMERPHPQQQPQPRPAPAAPHHEGGHDDRHH
jgi:hypothetical protein